MRSWILFIAAALLYSCNTTPPKVMTDGILEVPENRKNPNSRTLKLVYKVLKAKDTTSPKAPILFLSGGPGGATLIMEKFWGDHPLRNDRDIVLMDQRGTGASEANCIESGDAMFTILRQDLDQEGVYRALDALLSECKETIKQKGVDLAGYNSRENAADFEDLRKALGYDKWNLFGGSYGSRLGLTIMRDFPNSVRSAVLFSILAPETNYFNSFIINFENSLFSVLDRCKKNKDCNSQYPDLKVRLLKTLKNMRTTPLRFEYEGKLFVLNAYDALGLLHLLLYERQSIGTIPPFIEALESGETEPITKVLQRIESLYTAINWPMNYSVVANEILPFYDEAAMDKSLKQSEIRFERAFVDSAIKLLSNWHSYRAPDFEHQPVISEIPTLIASGGIDHVTPVSDAKASLKYLKNGYELIFPDEGHNLFNPCFFKIAEDFINNPAQKPDSECSSKRNPIEWTLLKPVQ